MAQDNSEDEDSQESEIRRGWAEAGKEDMFFSCTHRRKTNIGSRVFDSLGLPQSLIKSVQCKCETFCSCQVNPFGHLLDGESDNTSALSDRLRRSIDCDRQSGH